MCAASAFRMLRRMRDLSPRLVSETNQSNQPVTVRWSSIRRPVTSGGTFLPVIRAAPSEIGSPVPRSGLPLPVLMSGCPGELGVVRLLAVAVEAQARHRMRTLGFEAVLLAVPGDVLGDHVL